MRRAAVRPTIQKFGGASLDGGRAIARALALIAGGPRPTVVVVSALAGVTDGLLALAARDATGHAALAETLRKKHLAAARAAVPPGPARRRLSASIREAFEEVRALSRLPAFAQELSPAALDHLLARGENLSARILAAGLSARGVPAELVDARELIRTDGRAGGASPLPRPTDAAARARLMPLLARGGVPVVPGFLGASPDGRVVTLGRGGSDLTATLLARALRARALILWKDVPGFLTADPRVVADARVLPQLHPREAAELAYYGARVLHPRALIPLVGRRVPIFVRPFADPAGAGTEISARRTLRSYPVKALSAISGQALVTVTGNGMLGVPGIAARTFAALHQEGISVSLISQASSEHSICLAVPESQARAARAGLRRAFEEEIRRREIDGVELLPGLSTVSVVGLGMAGTPGIAARVFSALAARGVNVIAIAQGSSELNISFVVAGADAGKAQRAIHESFQLSKIGGGAVAARERCDVALLGFGQVGATLARMLASSRGRRLRLCAVIDRSGFVFHPGGFSPGAVERLARAKRRGATVAAGAGGARAAPREAVAFLARHALSRPILVDATADATGPILESAAAAGFDLVLANKRPLSGARRESESLEEAVRRAGRRLRFEATVGAGLPILDTHRKLVESGDRVLKIEGCLSGTIGHVLSEIERGQPFSAAVRGAIASRFAEPDPREDLSGADVGRKALILARLLGFRGGPREVRVAPLIGAGSRRLSLPRFLAGLQRFDAAWDRRMRAARSRGRVLRYVASVSRAGARAALAEVAPDSPFAALRGTANLVAFTTRRYRASPLVIQGPGAGLAVTAAGLFNDLSELAAS